MFGTISFSLRKSKNKSWLAIQISNEKKLKKKQSFKLLHLYIHIFSYMSFLYIKIKGCD
jgi:hypothetical protein